MQELGAGGSTDGEGVFSGSGECPPVPRPAQRRGAEAARRSLWRESIDFHIENLHHVAENIDDEQVGKSLALLRECRGSLVFTGVGQNKILASKIASTYNSLNIRAAALDPVSAIHGAMGGFDRSDLLIVLSKSGETTELLNLLRHWQTSVKSLVLSFHSVRGSSMDKWATRSVHIPSMGEADHLDLAPTASSTAILSLLQSLAVQIAQERNLTREDFVRTHPAGTIGQSLDE